MKILLVEDVRAMAMVMAARLGSFGHHVLHAENGQQALEIFKAEAPDLVLMDIEMPVMNGFETTNHIRAFEALQQWAWTPIVFLTASDTVENLVTAIEAGGDDFMAKSVPEPVLHAKMKAMSRIASLRQRLSLANSKLEELASRDSLTGLNNRRYLDLHLDVAWAEAMRTNGSIALLMLDIDNFKKYNDHYGHHVGDDCLRDVAQAIATATGRANQNGLSQHALAARYGGEEFVIMIPHATPLAYEAIAQAIVDEVRQCQIPHEQNRPWGMVTVSIGGVFMPSIEGDIGAMFRLADKRLYQAKEKGRNRAELD